MEARSDDNKTKSLLSRSRTRGSERRPRTYLHYATPQAESYPISLCQTEFCPCIIEAIRDRTSPIPDEQDRHQDKCARLARTEPNKQSSSFELAIHNKDFDYFNQCEGIRGLLDSR
ncbi:GL26500 [Drosophila persimilis]|uniref:GL26500 n=1 Tax=Drosophila persimilis TaxID=7234 RepID=B4GSE9_DROPE|nr:GL26500 [Drosophila persimilis]